MVTPSIALADTLVRSLISCGVTHAVVCPGSRSAPLAYAWYAAEQRGEATLHMHVDERSAGFLALGIGLASGGPACVVTTSGTAVANLMPAVCEADAARIPLLAMTADRPPELHGCGANQTMEQNAVFGGRARRHVRIDASIPHAAVASIGARAWRAARGGATSLAGPVHLNVALRDPLHTSPEDHLLLASSTAAAPSPCVHAAVLWQEHGAPSPFPVVPRTLVVLGDVPWEERPALGHLLENTPFPVLAEPTALRKGSWSTALPGGSAVTDATEWVEEHRPARLILVGRPTLTRGVRSLLHNTRSELVVISDDADWPDTSQRAAHVIARKYAAAVLAPTLSAPQKREGQEWKDAWDRAAQAAYQALDAVQRSSWPDALSVAWSTMQAASVAGRPLVVGPSAVARAADLARGVDAPNALSMRGLAGIDGVVSAAVGAAIVHAPRGAVALLGDLTFLHDSNALLQIGRQDRPPLDLVVLNDSGGGIFEQLEHAQAVDRPQFERLFGTSPQVCLASLCAGFGVPHHRIDSAEALSQALSGPSEGTRVYEVRINRAASQQARRQVHQAITHAVQGYSHP